MSGLKVGDKVFIGPFEILQFRDTNRPGPQDTGDSIIVTRGNHGALSADTSLTIPAVPNLAAVARVLAIHGSAVTAAVEMAYVDSVERGDRKELSDALRALAAALNGGGE